MIKSEKNVKSTKKKASTICGCGCKTFVWWVREKQCWSSNTPADCYSPARHPGAQCARCNRVWLIKGGK